MSYRRIKVSRNVLERLVFSFNRLTDSTRQLLFVWVFLLPNGLFQIPSPPTPEPAISDAIVSTEPIQAADYTGCGGQYPASVNAGFEQELVERVNAERTSRGIPPLKRVTTLDQAARYHARDMQQDGYFDHNTRDKSGSTTVLVCNWDVRITSYYPNWNSLGENIARGQPSPADAMEDWMNSQGHRDNILGTGFREIGVGYYTGNYWVQDFGKKNSVYPIIINNEAGQTGTRDVNLYIYGSSSTWPEMRLRNDNLSWSSWMPFQNTLAWQLPNSVEDHTVTAELRNGGITTSASDSIYLTTATSVVLGNLPDEIHFYYSIAQQRFLPNKAVLTPLDIANGLPMSWNSTQSGDWFTLAPTSGSSPGSFTITPFGDFSQPDRLYTGSVTVIVTAPDTATGSPHVINVSLWVVDEPFFDDYIPYFMFP